jgi:GTP cyclohydrolase I
MHRVNGYRKINRIVQFFAQRPQVQERLTQQILTALQTLLGTSNSQVLVSVISRTVTISSTFILFSITVIFGNLA